jgi:hypothetical protein
MFPGASMGKEFAWTDAHPVADVYRAYKPMPYDTPSFDLAAVHYASQPESGFFQLSEPGTATVSDSGMLSFTPGGGGRIRRLSVDPARREHALQALVDLASARPATPPSRGRGPA